MHVGSELATAVCMAEEVPNYSEYCTERLERDMPS